MLKIERQNFIMNELKNEGSILISNLSESLNCHEETIRRDLKELESAENSNVYTAAPICLITPTAVCLLTCAHLFSRKKNGKWLRSPFIYQPRRYHHARLQHYLSSACPGNPGF